MRTLERYCRPETSHRFVRVLWQDPRTRHPIRTKGIPDWWNIRKGSLFLTGFSKESEGRVTSSVISLFTICCSPQASQCTSHTAQSLSSKPSAKAEDSRPAVGLPNMALEGVTAREERPLWLCLLNPALKILNYFFAPDNLHVGHWAEVRSAGQPMSLQLVSNKRRDYKVDWASI